MAYYGGEYSGWIYEAEDFQTYDPDTHTGKIVTVGEPTEEDVLPEDVRGEDIPDEVVRVGIDTNGDGQADVYYLATPGQLEGRLDYGEADPTPEDSIETEFDAPDDDPGSIESGTTGSFTGETVVVPQEAFAAFLTHLESATSAFQADGPLRSLEVGPGNTPQGAVLRGKLNTESGEITKTYIETAQEVRKRLQGLCEDLRTMSQNYQQGQDQIELDARTLVNAFSEARGTDPGVATGIETGTGATT